MGILMLAEQWNAWIVTQLAFDKSVRMHRVLCIRMQDSQNQRRSLGQGQLCRFCAYLVQFCSGIALDTHEIQGI